MEEFKKIIKEFFEDPDLTFQLQDLCIKGFSKMNENNVVEEFTYQICNDINIMKNLFFTLIFGSLLVKIINKNDTILNNEILNTKLIDINVLANHSPELKSIIDNLFFNLFE